MQQSILEKIAKLLCCATNLPERQENTIEDKRESNRWSLINARLITFVIQFDTITIQSQSQRFHGIRYII